MGTGLSLYAEPSVSSALLLENVAQGTTLTVLEYTYDAATRFGWYKVSVGETVGWMHSGYVALTDAASLEIDMACLDAFSLGSEFLLWHSSGGNCVQGLLYRRVGEAKIITFANYAEADMASGSYKVNTYGYQYPACMAQYER